ncbi:MAG TPA: AI-2E family transporter [Pseudolabrys sp.]|nr:AI-2E family transporter [Pseudolabrys sp.]
MTEQVQESSERPKVAQVAAIGIFVLLFIGFLDLARVPLLPVTAAFVIGTLLGPIAERGRAYRIPQWLTALVLVLLLIGAMNALIVLLAAPVSDWVSKAPEIGVRLKEKLALLDYPMQLLRSLRDALNPGGDHSAPIDFGVSNLIQPALGLLSPAIGFVTPAIGQLLIFFGTLFFFLSSRVQLRGGAAVLFDDHQSRLRVLHILSEIEMSLTAYFSTVAVIYLADGILTGLASYLIGLPNPAAWGALAFVLCFIPYIGPGIVIVVLFGVGLIHFPTVTQALFAPAFFVALSAIEGNFITPAIVGRRLTLSPLAVFLSLVFWAWLWGPIGAFLATPLLIIGLVTAGQFFAKEGPDLPG